MTPATCKQLRGRGQHVFQLWRHLHTQLDPADGVVCSRWPAGRTTDGPSFTSLFLLVCLLIPTG